jgi:rare lipoprotein A
MRIFKNTILIHNLLVLALLLPVLGVFGQKINYRNIPIVDTAIGNASFYSDKFIGKKTANGEVFSQEKLTCAHNTYPLGSKVKVTNLKNGKSVVLRVNDRLHHRNPRLVDLSSAGANKLGFKKSGIVKVRVELWVPEKENLSKSQ